MQNIESTEDVENFMLKHGENIVDTLGAQVDRIEKLLKVGDYYFHKTLRIDITSSDSTLIFLSLYCDNIFHFSLNILRFDTWIWSSFKVML